MGLALKGVHILAHNQHTYAKEEAELQHKGILHLEDMFSKQQNSFVMNVTYVVVTLCLAGDKKNRSKAKWKQNGAYRHRETITVLCLISI